MLIYPRLTITSRVTKQCKGVYFIFSKISFFFSFFSFLSQICQKNNFEKIKLGQINKQDSVIKNKRSVAPVFLFTQPHPIFQLTAWVVIKEILIFLFSQLSQLFCFHKILTLKWSLQCTDTKNMYSTRKWTLFNKQDIAQSAK